MMSYTDHTDDLFHMAQRNIDVAIQTTSSDNELLEKKLKLAQFLIADLKINNHFFFNTLNQMALMALEGSGLPLYQSIISLSQLFRQIQQNAGLVVTLFEEVNALYRYIDLQKIRYTDRLSLKYDIRAPLKKWYIPFNTLIPLMENAFTHGFSDSETMYLILRIYEENRYLRIDIENNIFFSEKGTRQNVEQSVYTSTNHGLSMIYEKLQSHYTQNFEFKAETVNPCGFAVHITLPYYEK